MPKLIIIRGNSGSGKSSTARLLRDQLTGKVALIEQDYIRRIILREKEKSNGDNIELIFRVVEFLLQNGYDVILEGIFYTKKYSNMLHKLIKQASETYAYYFDISLEETFRRHATKPNSADFGEEEMRSWYHHRDLLGIDGEVVISENMSQAEILARILKDIS